MWKFLKFMENWCVKFTLTIVTKGDFKGLKGSKNSTTSKIFHFELFSFDPILLRWKFISSILIFPPSELILSQNQWRIGRFNWKSHELFNFFNDFFMRLWFSKWNRQSYPRVNELWRVQIHWKSAANLFVQSFTHHESSRVESFEWG